ncbi:MAG: FGGY-family carbohydrate kinase [Phormidesmis sp.]
MLCHQADWLAGLLHAQPPVSDYHNVLKLGYDVRQLCYPDWLLALPIAAWLPEVKVPGAVIAAISPDIARRFAIPTTCQICAGTTDSIAAFLASGAVQAGDAVTSLGSTLVLKLLSKTRIDDQAYGVYSHRLGDLWLVGGASNTGGAVLKTYFSSDKIAQLSAQIDLSLPCNLHYYPLNSPGERFPVNDPDRLPQLTPRPESDVEFLYGMLDAIARIEAEGYQKLQSLGAPALRRLYTAGGGAKNEKWQQLRARHLYHLRGEVAVMRAESTEAAYGTATLAMNGLN